MDISCFHKRKIEKSWLPSSILIRYAFQHNFLGLFIPTNNMRCGILSHVENVLVKINLRIESRKKRSVYTQFLYISSRAVFSTADWQILNLKTFSLKRHVLWSTVALTGACGDEKGRANM